MKYQLRSLAMLGILFSSPLHGEEAIDPTRLTNILILKEIEVKNLGIETVKVNRSNFEETIFSLGRIAAIPSKRCVVSSRIPGRIIEMKAFEGDSVISGQDLLKIESRQPGNPPPSVSLSAPFAGLVMATHASLGESIEPDTDIIEIIDLSEVHAVARVPEDQAGKLKKGIEARIVIPALPGENFKGELVRFGTMADRASGTIDAFFYLKGLTGKIRPEMRAEFSIVVKDRQKVMSIPKEALQGDDVSPFVFVKDFELKNAFVKVPIRIGSRNDHFIEVLSGLYPLDEVVTKGAYSLAFAGSGSISLKEALDAAHGHKHNEDGTEKTTEQILASSSGQGNSKNNSQLTIFLAILSAVLTALLILSLIFRRSSKAMEVANDQSEPETNNRKSPSSQDSD